MDQEEDNYTEVVRKDRRSLMIAGLIGIVASISHLVPKEIQALGITFQGNAQAILLYLLACINFYFLAAFLIHWDHARAEVLRRSSGDTIPTVAAVKRMFVQFSINDLDTLEKDVMARLTKVTANRELSDKDLRQKRTMSDPLVLEEQRKNENLIREEDKLKQVLHESPALPQIHVDI